MLVRGSAKAFSLYELIITVAVVGTILSLGIPSFGSIVADHRLRTDVDALFHAVYLARKESVFRRRAVTLCPTDGARDCLQDNDWSAGWMMFVNLDRDLPAVRDPGEPVLKEYSAGGHSRVIANRRSFSFRTTALRATNGTVIFCDKSGRTEPRALVISYTGRPRVARNDRRGRPYECPE